jgi:MFS family permease
LSVVRSASQTAFDEPLPPEYRWNALAFGADSALFTIGMSFVSITTVLPSLIVRLTPSELAVGIVSGLAGGAWLLPQLLVASAVARMPRKKPIVAIYAWIGRLTFLGTAAAIHWLAEPSPRLALGILLASLLVFYVIDAVVSVPWFDLLAKAIPPRRRGRVLGTAQVLGGLGGMAVGVFVRFALGASSPWPYPANYAILFAIAAVVLLAAAGALTCIREPLSETSSGSVPSVKEVLALLPRILTRDRAFRRLVYVRLATGFVGMANAFYVLFAIEKLGLSTAYTGWFISAQVSGSLISGLVMRVLQDRLGPLVHLRALTIISMTPPLIALLAGLSAPLLGGGVLYAYLLVYFALGLYITSLGWPFFNWVLEHAGQNERPLYIGMFNTLGAATMLAPMLGGLVVSTISYPAVFLLAAAFAVLGLLLSLRLPDTRKGDSAEHAVS